MLVHRASTWYRFFEICTPFPKVNPPQSTSQLRNISGLLNFDTVFEKLISQMIISDMEDKIDPAQFGNQKGISIQHYLIQTLKRILSGLDNNCKVDVFAVVVIDWSGIMPF